MLVKENIKRLLLGTKREGIQDLIVFIEGLGFFESPASTKYHGAYAGGLAKHSMNLFRMFLLQISNTDSIGKIPTNSIIISSLLHDLCKAGAYRGREAPYVYNRANGRGHASLSIERIEKYIKLTDIEKDLIKYHMGVYSTSEYVQMRGYGVAEYSLKELTDKWNADPLLKLFHWCDDMVTQFLEKSHVSFPLQGPGVSAEVSSLRRSS